MSGLVITGAAGWLGLNILNHLCSIGFDRPVRVLARSDEEAARVQLVGEDLDLHIQIGDLACSSVLNRLFSGVGGFSVIHAAGVIHPTRLSDFERVNVGGTQSVVQFARNGGATRFVHISSNSPFGVNAGPGDYFRASEPYRPYLGYGRSKMRAELIVRGGGINYVILRPLWFYGPFQPERQATFFRMVRTGRFPLFSGGTNRRSLTFVPDLAKAALVASTVNRLGNSSWWIADSESYSMNEIVEAVWEAMRLEGFEVSHSTVQAPAIVSSVARAADRVIQAAGRYNAQVHVIGELGASIVADASEGRRVLGLDPVSDIVGGMRASIAWCRGMGIDV